MAYRIVVTAEAREQLDSIYDYISDAASLDIAARFTNGIVDHLASLADYPRTARRGTISGQACGRRPIGAVPRSHSSWKMQWSS